MHFYDHQPDPGRSPERRPSAMPDTFFGNAELAAKINRANLWLRPAAAIVDRGHGWQEQAPEEEAVLPWAESLHADRGNHGDLSSLMRSLNTERERAKFRNRVLATAVGAAVSGLLIWSAYRDAGQEATSVDNSEDTSLVSPG